MVCRGKHGSNKHTMEYTYGIPAGSLIWALASHQISRIHWLKRPGAGRSATSGRRSAGGLDSVYLVKELSGELGVRMPQADSEPGSQCHYPFEVRTQEETGSTRRL